MTSATVCRPDFGQVRAWLREVMDPEIPVVSVVDLGMVRQVAWDENEDCCVIRITPTYSACPAFEAIQERIREALERHGVRVRLEVHLAPPWTTDWLSAEAAQKLRAFHIAAPGVAQPPQSAFVQIESHSPPQCPHCGSNRTTLLSQFGSTLCKALYRCEECREPFDQFKSH